jgi:hypothetical protein
MKILRLIVVSSLLYGCASCGPASWAEETEARFQCGMSVEDVRKIAGRDVEQRDVPRDWSTHAIRDGSTDLWLGFPDGKLRFTQVLWAQKMMKMAMYSRIDLCGKARAPRI